ncbi:MAG: ferrous iron transport protein A [Epsilonproteobacteria bacterium]|nr:ferrous iron transport protein A [Campylobacterota bacterium]
MNLSELRKGDRGTILKINAGRELKSRLTSFGIYKGATFEIKACSLARNTLELEVGNSLVALRRGEVEKIEVEKNEA